MISSLSQLELQIHAQVIKTLRPHPLHSVIRSSAHSSAPELALHLFNFLLRRSAADHFLFTFAVKSCLTLLLRCSSAAESKAQEIHARAVKCGFSADIFLQNSLLCFYSTIGAIDFLKSVFFDIERPDVVSWTTFISGLAKNGRDEEAIAAFSLMKVNPNPLTLVAVLPVCSRLRYLKLGKAIHGYQLRISHGDRNLILDNAILDMYMRCGATRAACDMFYGMPERDVISWTTLISGFNWNHRPEEAISVFLAMVQKGEVVPNEATFVSALVACASMAELSWGKWVHSCMDFAGIPVDGLAGNALVNMYAKSGDLVNALYVFQENLHKDIASWNTILGAMALNGRSKQAIVFFSLMIRHGVVPDEVSFLAVISACCHSGMVNQGVLFLSAMERACGIIPEQKHYGCVVDMLARAGMLEESEAFAAKIMPGGIDIPVRTSWMKACKIHGLEARFREQLLDRNVNLKKTTGYSRLVISPSDRGIYGKNKKDSLREG